MKGFLWSLLHGHYKIKYSFARIIWVSLTSYSGIKIMSLCIISNWKHCYSIYYSNPHFICIDLPCGRNGTKSSPSNHLLDNKVCRASDVLVNFEIEKYIDHRSLYTSNYCVPIPVYWCKMTSDQMWKNFHQDTSPKIVEHLHVFYGWHTQPPTTHVSSLVLNFWHSWILSSINSDVQSQQSNIYFIIKVLLSEKNNNE